MVVAACFVSGRAAGRIPRPVIYGCGYVLLLTNGLLWFMWTPSPAEKWVFFLMATLDGGGASLIRVQCSGKYLHVVVQAIPYTVYVIYVV